MAARKILCQDCFNMEKMIVEGYAGCVDQGVMLYESDIPDLIKILKERNKGCPASVRVDKETVLKHILKNGKYFLAY